MELHNLAFPKKKSRKTIGRGGRRGTYSGRGVKGQKARSGGNVDPLFEGGRSSLVERMKKLRGHKALYPAKVTVTFAMLERVYEDGEVVSIETLISKKLLTKKNRSRGVKIVATGKLTKKLSVSDDIAFSESAAKLFVANEPKKKTSK